MKNSEQYIMYGTQVSLKWFTEWKSKNKDFVNNDKVIGSISCVFNGRDGYFLIIGEILWKGNNDNLVEIPMINKEHQEFVKKIVKERFGKEGEFGYFLIKNYDKEI